MIIERLRTYLWDRRFLVCLLTINVLGSIYGYYWYRDQLAGTNKLLWIFVADSPLATTLFTVVLLVYLNKGKMKFLPLLASAFLIKYGLWAVAINLHLLFLAEGFFLINFLLALSHLGMMVEGVLYYPFQGVSRGEAALVSGILIFQDFMDYGVGVHPNLFYNQQLVFAKYTALALTGIIISFIWYQGKNQRSIS